MSREDPKNIYFTCPEHSAKPDRRYLNWRLEHFLGRHVKKSFNDNKGQTEHLWIKIFKIDGGKLVGKVDNDPVFDIGIRFGNIVRVDRSEIEEVFEEGGTA